MKPIDNKNEKIVLYDDPDCVKYVKNIEGWVDRNSRFWGKDEHMARYSSSTHKKCGDCDNIIPKISYCKKCHEEKEIKRFNSLPMKQWDESVPIYSESADKYFYDLEDIQEYCFENNHTLESLRLVICEPVHPRIIDDEYWEDQLPEDNTIEDCDRELNRLIGIVNDYIDEEKPILSWIPGNYRWDYKKM